MDGNNTSASNDKKESFDSMRYKKIQKFNFKNIESDPYFQVKLGQFLNAFTVHSAASSELNVTIESTPNTKQYTRPDYASLMHTTPSTILPTTAPNDIPPTTSPTILPTTVPNDIVQQESTLVQESTLQQESILVQQESTVVHILDKKEKQLQVMMDYYRYHANKVNSNNMKCLTINYANITAIAKNKAVLKNITNLIIINNNPRLYMELGGRFTSEDFAKVESVTLTGNTNDIIISYFKHCKRVSIIDNELDINLDNLSNVHCIKLKNCPKINNIPKSLKCFRLDLCKMRNIANFSFIKRIPYVKVNNINPMVFDHIGADIVKYTEGDYISFTVSYINGEVFEYADV